ncbi:8655_t:CDS:1, partial [Racocetra persica]
WCHQPELRITIPALRHKIEDLATEFPVPFDAAQLLKDKPLDFDEEKVEEAIPKFEDDPEIEDDKIPEEE